MAEESQGKKAEKGKKKLRDLRDGRVRYHFVKAVCKRVEKRTGESLKQIAVECLFLELEPIFAELFEMGCAHARGELPPPGEGKKKESNIVLLSDGKVQT